MNGAKGVKRRDFLKAMGIGAASLALSERKNAFKWFAGKGGNRPNILFIMSDDHASNAISCYGEVLSKVFKTPNIDRLATEGMRLENCFCTNSICAPSRASILTGKYSHLNGVTNNSIKFDGNQETFPKLLQRSGYETALIGKWHLKSVPTGFDYWNILPDQGAYHNPEMIEMGDRQRHKGYVTDIITDFCISWLKKREGNKPFCLLFHHKAPHEAWEYAERHANLYKDIEIPEPPTFWDDYTDRALEVQGWWERIYPELAKLMERENWPTGCLDTTGMDAKQKKRAVYQKYLKDYLRCVAAIDESVGRLLDHLDKEDIFDDTIVIYTSDQGMFLGEHGWFDKRMIFEESIRVPFLVRYPREIWGGSVCDRIILNIDFAETFLDFAGVGIPEDMQGRSFRPLLCGKTLTDWRKSMFYAFYEGGSHYGVRTDRYKMVYYRWPKAIEEVKGRDLFDLEKDPLELRSVYEDARYAGVVKEMEAEMHRLMQELNVKPEDLP